MSRLSLCVRATCSKASSRVCLCDVMGLHIFLTLIHKILKGFTVGLTKWMLYIPHKTKITKATHTHYIDMWLLWVLRAYVEFHFIKWCHISADGQHYPVARLDLIIALLFTHTRVASIVPQFCRVTDVCVCVYHNHYSIVWRRSVEDSHLQHMRCIDAMPIKNISPHKCISNKRKSTAIACMQQFHSQSIHSLIVLVYVRWSWCMVTW